MTTTDTFPNYKSNLEQNRREILVFIPDMGDYLVTAAK